ncbi:MAG: hypothetical protein V4596_09795 [Bdellovibrionota bacterium]
MQSIYDSKNLIRPRIWKNNSKATQNCILIIPGGPGLSSDYLIDLSRNIFKATSKNVVLMDLPNHYKVDSKIILNYKSSQKKFLNLFLF